METSAAQPRPFALAAFENIDTGIETPVLPLAELPQSDSFVVFPRSADALTPVAKQTLRTSVPRFSIFRFAEVKLTGFRMLSVGDTYFNDQSLVDPVTANRRWAAKSQRGLNERVVIDQATQRPVGGRPIETIDCAGAAVLCIDEPTNYGSWLFRLLPKLLLMNGVEPPQRAMVHLSMSWMRPLIKTLFPDIELIHHDARRDYRLLNVVVPSLPAPDLYFRPEIKAALEPFIEQVLRKFPKTPELVYVSRRRQAINQPRRRVLENETALIERLFELGFAEVIPEDLPFDLQMATFARAKMIVSPGGANLFGCYFARNADLIIDMEATPGFVNAHAHLLASAGRPYSIVTGALTGRGVHPSKSHANWRISVNALLSGLRALGVRRGRRASRRLRNRPDRSALRAAG